MPRVTLSPGQLAQLACVLEATARKPGNVHRFADFVDATYLDFVLSASAIAGPLDRVRDEGVGAAVLAAVEATQRVVTTNTNLGMVLLLAPLAAVPGEVPLAEGIEDVLQQTTIDDARLVYRAIRLSRPSGLGNAPEQDVNGEPTVTLREAMRLAADRDLVARQYADGFAEVFQIAVPALRGELGRGLDLESSIIHAFMVMLATHPDTLIVRKRGWDEAREVSRRASEVLAGGWPENRAGMAEFDAWLRAEGHARNPGATADLISAALFATLRDGTIKLPRPAGPSGWSGDGGTRGPR
jgi:triphosphoribosyl-dephospho-CoA synthase